MSELFPDLPGGLYPTLEFDSGAIVPPFGLTVSNAGASPLVQVVVKPFLRENQYSRKTSVRIQTAAGDTICFTGNKLRRQHLLALGSATSVKALVGIKDEYEVWSEATLTPALSATNYSAGSTEASIASGTTDTGLLEQPSIAFPDIAVGSGQISVHLTLMGTGFFDETRRAVMNQPRAAFRVKLEDMDEIQQQMLQRFYAALNGPMTPFLFDWMDPLTRTIKQYAVRFRDPSMTDQLVQTTLYDADFTLIELTGASLPNGI